MKIFITGSTGYIGQRLTETLLQQGHEVHALCRRQPDSEFYRHANYFFHEGEIQNADDVEHAMKDCHVVFHLAAIAKVWMKNPADYYTINVNGTINVLSAALKNNVRKVVFTSSAAIYGASNGAPMSEDDIRNHGFFTDYESSKFIAEERVQHFVRKGLDVVIVHPTKVYGPGIWTESNAVSQLIKLFLEGEWHVIPGDGRMIGNFSFIDDVVNGHLLAMLKGRPGEKYILGGVNISFNDFFQQLKKISGKEFLTWHVPYRMMMLYGWQEEVIAKLFGKEPKITRPWIRKYNHDLALSSNKAIRELGYCITPFEDGLSKTIEWLNSKMNIYY
jgi:nucleoside-diphosphate-sugar epimerase